MVDSISNLAGSSILQSQNVANKASTNALTQNKTAQNAARSVFDQLSQTIDQGKNLMKQSTALSTLASQGPRADLPRGSLIDIVV